MPYIGEVTHQSPPFTFLDESTGSLVTTWPDTVEVNGQTVPTRAGVIRALGLSGAVLLNPVQGQERSVIEFPCGLTVWPDEYRVTVGEEQVPIEFSKTEFLILSALAINSPNVQKHDEILKVIDKIPGENCDKFLAVYVSYIRKSLWGCENVEDPRLMVNRGIIKTIRGVGYRMGPRAFSNKPLTVPST